MARGFKSSIWILTVLFASVLQAQEVNSDLAESELVYALPPGETISFYTRVAPDLSAIGFTKTKEAVFDYAPVVLDLHSEAITSMDEVRYDPTFSPDYDLAAKQGFVFGARGGATRFAKSFAFYLPGEFDVPKREYSFSNISGYATVARLEDEGLLPPVLAPFKGQYFIMGKQWRWFIVEPVRDATGRIVDVRRVHPAKGDLAAEPLCSNLNLNFDKADSMISPRGRFISAKKMDRDKVPVIVRTKDCTILATPSLNGLFGGKASFSNDERFMAFHAFGPDGKQHVVDQMTNDNLIKKWADRGLVANIFLYDIVTGRLARLTKNDAADSAINFFPNFSGDGKWIYFHRHEKNGVSTEIHRVLNPLVESDTISPSGN